MTPDAINRVGAMAYREAIIALLLQEGISVSELAERLGFPDRGLRRFIYKAEAATNRSRSRRFPEQYLVSKMLDSDTRDRIMRPTQES